MAVTLNNSQISAGLYSAFWNRAADSTGQNHWVGILNSGAMTQLEIATYFYNSDEGRDAYPNWIRNDPAALVNQVYLNVFERPADAQGLAFYVAQLNKGTSFPQVVLNMMANAINSAAAGNTDGQQFLNEIQVSIYVSETLRSNDPYIVGTALQGVTYEQSSVEIREAQLYAMANVGETYTLTTGINDITGTPLNDTFNAPLSTIGSTTTAVNTLQASDVLNGNGGVDTLNAQLNASVNANLTNIEIINATASAAVTLGLQNSAAVTNVNNNASTDALTVTGIAAGASNFGVANTSKATTFTDTVGVVRTSANLTLENSTGAVTITSPTVNLVSQGTVANSVALTDTALTNLNVAGASAITVTGLAATATVINGAATTGGLTVTLPAAGTLVGGSGNDALTGSAGNDVITSNDGNDTVTAGTGADLITTGNGIDRIVFTADGDLTVADTVSGGLGVDTLVSTTANLAGPTYTNISGIDNVEVSNTLAANLTLSAIQAGISGATLNGTGGKTVTFDSGVAGTVVLAAAAGAAVNVASAGTGITDSLTIVNGTTATDVIGKNTIGATGVETLTLNLGSATATLQQVGAIAGISGTTAVVINGNNDVTLTGQATAGSINASGLTGTAVFSNVGQATIGVTSIIGSANGDTIVGSATATSIDGGAGNDTITGGAAADFIAGGAGNDLINGAAGNDVIHGDAGDDLIEVDANTVSNVTIDGGAGNDTVNVNNTLAIGDSIDGGAGVNTFAMNTALIANYAGVTNFSNLRLNALMTQDVSKFTGTAFNEVDLAVAGAYTLSGLADATAIDVKSGGTITAATHATDTASNTLSIGGLDAAGVTINSVTANDSNTLTFTNGHVTAGNQMYVNVLNAIQANAINFTGTANEYVGIATAGTGTGFGETTAAARTITVDGSANTGTVFFDGANAAANQLLNITGSSTNLNTLNGGAGNDVITGGAVNDTLAGAAGNDTISGGAGNDSITGGSGIDSISGGTGNDTITGGTSGDTIDFGTGTDTAVYTAAGETATNLVSSGVTVLTGVDTVLNATAGDIIDGNVAFAGAISATLMTTGAHLAGDVAVVLGNYNSLTGIFTQSLTGQDTLVQYAATTADAGIQDIVLVGYATAGLSTLNGDSNLVIG